MKCPSSLDWLLPPTQMNMGEANRKNRRSREKDRGSLEKKSLDVQTLQAGSRLDRQLSREKKSLERFWLARPPAERPR